MTTPDAPDHIDAATASRLLQTASTARDRVQSEIDRHTEARITGWMAAAIFIYVLTLLSLFTAPEGAGSVEGVSGISYVNVLLFPFLAMTQLVQGARDGLRVSVIGSFRGSKSVLFILGLVPFFVLMVLSVASIEYPWWVGLLAAGAAAAPAAASAARSARAAGARGVPQTRGGPLSAMARNVTLGLGIAFGIAGATTPYSWFPVVVLGLMLGLVALLAGYTSRWGLPSIGSEWGQRQWVSFGVSFSLLFVLAVVTARTPWNGPAVAGIAALLIATPLVASAFASGRRR